MISTCDNQRSCESYEFNPYQIAFVGHSNTGKTTLISKILKVLSSKYKIGYVKHDAHSFTIDHEGKDTYRAWESGASDVYITDQHHSAFISRGNQHSIQKNNALINCDLVIIEGYKNLAIDKIVVIDKEKEILSHVAKGAVKEVVAFVGESTKQDNLPINCPYFHRDDVDGIVNFILDLFNQKTDEIPLWGLVLSGGYSTRMQSDKSLLNYHGKPQSDHCYQLLNEQLEKVFVSIRQGQWNAGTLNHLSTLTDRFLQMGPLSGILTAMITNPEAAWLVLACDLPNVSMETISHLIKCRNPLKMATAYSIHHDECPEPLCAIYEPKILIHLLEGVAAGKMCPKKILANVPVETLALTDEHTLENINTIDQYQEAIAKVKKQMKNKKKVTVKYFAALKEQAMNSCEKLETTATNAEELFDELDSKYSFKLKKDQVKVAVNGRFEDARCTLNHGDTVVFIPPVAGG